jgi:hypothetical protein
MKNEETLGSIAIAKVNTALQPLWRSVVPIFRVGDVREPEAFGSAVLIELAGQRFLVTARHVVDEYLKSRIHTVGASGFAPPKPVWMWPFSAWRATSGANSPAMFF